jgi:predicted dehydrogenase
VVNWLIIGTGDIVRKRAAAAIASEAQSQIRAFCSRSQESAQELADQYSAIVYTDLTAALQDKDIDAVYIATPVFLHVPMAIECLKAGKHVLVEKPLALSYAQAQELIEVSRKTDVKCAVAYYRRYYPKYAAARDMLKNGDFGQVVLIRMTYFAWTNPPAGSPRSWSITPEKAGGGPLYDMGCHMLDVMIGLFGLPESVYARVETLTHDYPVEDSSVVIMKYKDGPQVIASFNWNSKTWSHEFEIVGTEAKVKWHPYDAKDIVKTTGRDIEQIELPNAENIHAPLIEDFVSSIVDGKEPQTTVIEAAKTNLLLDAIGLSARKNREVKIDDF